MSKYRKFFVALAGLLTAGASALADGLVTSQEAEALVLAAATAVGVYFFRNDSPEA